MTNGLRWLTVARGQSLLCGLWPLGQLLPLPNRTAGGATRAPVLLVQNAPGVDYAPLTSNFQGVSQELTGTEAPANPKEHPRVNAHLVALTRCLGCASLDLPASPASISS